MPREITIDPVTRIEGHAKITLTMDDLGRVSNARFAVTQFRGFEKLCEGRPFYEMPSLTARICGICPVSHLVASAKACDQILKVWIPEPAVKLRQVLNLAQIIQSHALSFFHLSGPDLLLGMDSDPAKRNIFGLLDQNPQIARDGIRLRQFGQSVIERLAGKRIHPAWVVAGGVSSPLALDVRDAILMELPEALAIARRTLDAFKLSIEGFREEIRTFGNFPTLFMGLVKDGHIEHYSGSIRVLDALGKVIEDRTDHDHYDRFIGEKVEPDSYLKSPYYLPYGPDKGMYRVGPLARMNLADACGTPLADAEKAEFRGLQRCAILSSFHYHYARLIEIIHCLEKMQMLLEDPDILSHHVRAFAQPNANEGVGISEAPRGILIHHYKIDDNGLIRWVNLIIATGHNNMAINKGILQAAKRFVCQSKLSEGSLNRCEAVIRAFDPCFSCSTHALGQMPLHIQLIDPEGKVIDEKRR